MDIPSDNEATDQTFKDITSSTVKKRKSGVSKPRRTGDTKNAKSTGTKKIVDISEILRGRKTSTNCDEDVTNALPSDILVDMVLNRAQTLKNYMDRIKNQGIYLPMTFTPEGMSIEMLEAGKKSWVHAEIWKHGCESYAYGHDQPSVQITLVFKDFLNLLKTTDANDKLNLRIYRSSPIELHLNIKNDRAEMTLQITSVQGDPKSKDLKAQLEKRINDLDDFEYKIETNELQRKINTLSNSKIESVKIHGEGEDLIITHSNGPEWCVVRDAHAKFKNTLIRPPVIEGQSEEGIQKEHYCEHIPVMLRFLMNVCKGPSNSSNSGSNHGANTISLRIGNNGKDLLIVENLGSFGRVVLGVRPEVSETNVISNEETPHPKE